jgi:hypothetical protein
MSTVRDIATVPRRAIEEAKPHHASIPALIPPADPVRLNPIQPNPWAETLGVFFIAAVIASHIHVRDRPTIARRLFGRRGFGDF